MSYVLDLRISEREFALALGLVAVAILYDIWGEQRQQARALWSAYDELHTLNWHIAELRDQDEGDDYEHPGGSA